MIRVGLGVLGEALSGGDRAAKARQRAVHAAEDLLGAHDREHVVDQLGSLRRAAEDVQAVADLHVLDLAQVAVDVQYEVVELRLARHRLLVQVAVQFGRGDDLPDLRAQRRDLGRVERLDRGVLVEQLLQLGELAVRVGAGHRRDHVVDDGRVRTPFGLRALAGVVDDERVDQRQLAEHGVRGAGR